MGAQAVYWTHKNMGKSMKKSMKAMKSGMKGMKKKAMKKSVIAKGKRAKSSVFRGTKNKTSGGLKKSDLRKNKSGKIVSKKASDAAKEVREERPWQMDQGSERGAQVDGNQWIPSRRRKVSQGPGLVEEGALLVQEMSLVMKKNLDCNFKINGLRIEWGSPAFEPQTN